MARKPPTLVSTHGLTRAPTGPRIGHYGCARGDRVVSVTLVTQPPDARHFPRVLHDLDCPACGFTHDAHPTWRALTEHELEQGKEGEVQWNLKAKEPA